MVSKSGKPKPNSHDIRFVRILRRDQTIQPIRGGTASVKPGSTHHICLFELPESTAEKPKRVMVAVTMLEVVQRLKRNEPLIQRTHPTIPEARFLFSLSRGEAVHATFKGCEEDVYIFRTSAATTSQMWFVHHADARRDSAAEGAPPLKKFSAKPNTLNAVKISVDLLGRIRNAND